MSKKLDYDNLTDADKDWLRARGWGNRIPGEEKSDPHASAVVLDADESAESILSKTPNVGTATYPADHGVPVNPVNPEGYTEEDYTAWKVTDLEAEVTDRNKEREDDALIQVEGTGKDGKVLKTDLVSALVADDAAHEPTGNGDAGNGDGDA